MLLLDDYFLASKLTCQKQPPIGVPRKKCSENMQQIYRRTPMPCWSAISIKLLCNFIQIVLRHGWSPVNCMHIFRKPFLKNTSGWLLLPFDGILFSYYVYFVKYKLSMAAHPRMKFRLFQSTWYFSVKIFYCLYEWSRGRGYVMDIFVVSPYITKIVWSKNFQSHLTITFKYFA